MFTFHNTKSYQLPLGFLLEKEQPPSPKELNRLLYKCNADIYSPKKLGKAFDNSFCNLSILQEKTLKLSGFVRITTDQGLNANLWDLVAEPGKNQHHLLAFLINSALSIIRKNLPGCSISIASPSMAIQLLEDSGFIIDPGGIRTMAYKI
ncbi:N-acetyltransferase [Prochlorococcus marinus]|uniref:N-acetyltransferase n=1 Tax=Prochlorococcus marinus TaxID=1219 RepID=UPI0022B4E8A0|nr:N-acetyltransferase [Prochlorococcus marinus]